MKTKEHKDKGDKNVFRAKYSTFIDGWLPCLKFNNFIDGVNIIPFKCPLDKEYDPYLNKENRFRFQEVYDFSVRKKKPITDVIDLMNKPRYNANNGFFPANVKYHTFRLASQSIPDPVNFQKIINFMDDLIKNNRVIGVHCKHGLNRTGFIICSYLVTRLGWDPAKAIRYFTVARGHEIVHDIYIRAIFSLKPKIAKKNTIQKHQEPAEAIQKESIINRNEGFLPKWLRFSKFNQFISDVNIIPFKCPLDQKYEIQLTKSQQFRFKEVYDFSIQENKRITDVIDLTNKSRYNPQTKDFFPPDVQYYNFRFPGKAIPDKITFETIMNLMEDLIKKGRVIGIHCKNGVNKTGLIICSFLVTRLGWDPNVALKSFVMARSHEIINETYIKAILSLQPKIVSNHQSFENMENAPDTFRAPVIKLKEFPVKEKPQFKIESKIIKPSEIKVEQINEKTIQTKGNVIKITTIQEVSETTNTNSKIRKLFCF